MVRAREKQLLKSVGLVGCGEIAVSYLPCLRACGGQVARVFDPDLARAAAITAPGGAAEGAVTCASLDELLACTDVEIVLNLTPVQHHAEVSRAALLAGKHVWSEKPLAQTQQDALELVALAHQRGLELVFSPRSSRLGGRRAALHQLRALHLLLL
jgi:predicted dehydrogenase